MSGEPVALLVAGGPRGDRSALERFEMALALVSFDFHLHVLFTGEGVWHLQENQTTPADERNFTRGWFSLPALGQVDLVVDGNALAERGLSTTVIPPPFGVVNAEQWQAALRRCRWVL